MRPEIVGLSEIADMLRVSRQRVYQLVQAYDDFPKPAAKLSAGRVWWRTDINAWMNAHPDRKPGRPRI